MPRILFYNHTRQVSGGERVLLAMLAALGGEGVELTVACPTEGAGELDSLVRGLAQERGVRVVSVPVLEARFSGNPVRLVRYLGSVVGAVRDFRRTVRLENPDLLHANSVRAGIVATAATMGMRTLGRTRTPILWHVQDDLPRHPISVLIRCFAWCSGRTQICAVSQATTKAFAGGLPFGRRIHVLHNAIDTERFPAKTRPPDGAALAFRAELGLTDADFLVVAVGMINPRKGLLELVEGFENVQWNLANRGRRPAHLAIVGAPIFNDDHLYEAKLHARAKALGLSETVHFLGERADVPAILRGADLLVHNAAVEPFGLVILEAMASGTPVIAAAVGGVPEIIEEGVNGELAPSPRGANYRDREELPGKIYFAASNPEAMEPMASMALRETVPRFSVEAFGQGLRGIHAGILEEERAKNNPQRTQRAREGHERDSGARIAVFHDNFCQMGGGERVAEELHRSLAAQQRTALHSTLSAHKILTPYLRRAAIQNTWMQRLPARAKLFRAYFLLYPFAVDHVDLTQYDVVVSSCFGYAKGIHKRADALHICYCHTPMRWVWRTEDYLSREKNSRVKTALLALPLRWLKRWEMRAARQPDVYIANSQVVAERLKQAFGVEAAAVIPPPIDTERFAPLAGHEADAPEDFYLVLSRLVPYKRFDLAIGACIALGRPLVVIGDGPDRERLERLAAGAPNIRFLGRAPDEVVADHARRTRALLSPWEEDFGMTPLEVNAAGRPAVAFRGGGATETIVEGLNGVFFEEATAESLARAMLRLEGMDWDAAAIRAHAAGFGVEVFRRRVREFVAEARSGRR